MGCDFEEKKNEEEGQIRIQGGMILLAGLNHFKDKHSKGASFQWEVKIF